MLFNFGTIYNEKFEKFEKKIWPSSAPPLLFPIKNPRSYRTILRYTTVSPWDKWFHLRGIQSRRQHFFYNINEQRTLRSWFQLFTSNLHLEHTLRILSLHICISLFQFFCFNKFLRFLRAFSSTQFHYSQFHNSPFKYKININKTKRLDKLEISVCLIHK